MAGVVALLISADRGRFDNGTSGVQDLVKKQQKFYKNQQHQGDINETTEYQGGTHQTNTSSTVPAIILCNRCEEEKVLDNCWCVIDSKTKQRYYECKKTCQKAIPIDITIPSNIIIEEQVQSPGQHPEPEEQKGLLERAWKWFSGGTGEASKYQRMKVE